MFLCNFYDLLELKFRTFDFLLFWLLITFVSCINNVDKIVFFLSAQVNIPIWYPTWVPSVLNWPKINARSGNKYTLIKKMKFFVKDFFIKREQILMKRKIYIYLLKKY